MVFCGPHLSFAFHFNRGPGVVGAAKKNEGKLKVSLYLVAPPSAAAVYSTNSSFCWRSTFRNKFALRNLSFRGNNIFLVCFFAFFRDFQFLRAFF